MNLKTIISIIKSEIIIAAISWLLSFVVMAVCWVARIEGGYLNNYIGDMITAFFVFFLATSFAYTAVWLVKNTKKNQLLNMRNENGYSDEYFSALKDRYILKTKFSLAFKNALFISGEYADANRFDEALEVLSVIDCDRCNYTQKIRLACEYLKIYSLSKNESDANSVYITILETASYSKLKKDVFAYVKYSGALYEYLLRDYEQAAKSTQEAYELSKDKKLKTDSALMLGLSCLKLGDKESAKHYAEVSSKNISTPAQRENLLSLMSAVERAYGI